jgi:phage host-nuclease inhibitor protein Gam
MVTQPPPSSAARLKVAQRLHAIGLAQARLETVQTALDEELDTLRRRYASRIAALQGRLSRLLADLEGFCRSKREYILPAGRKCLATPFGGVAFRKSDAVLRLCEGVTEDEACRLLRAARLASLVRGREALDRPAIYRALGEGRVGEKQLRRCGLEVEEGPDSFHCKVRRCLFDAAPALRRASP